MFKPKAVKSPAAMPRHVAIVMDGNGRWAKKRFLPRLAGHRQGYESLRRMVDLCLQRGIEVLTVFAFSSENWKRPVEEVSGLMDLLVKGLMREVPKLGEQGVRMEFPGERQGLSELVRSSLEQARAQTACNDRLVLNICFNYGGRWDIVQAAQQLALRGEAITEASLAAALSMAQVPDPDLVIRTGGEQRISNFMLWQSAYSEFYFSDKLWPDFDAAEFDRALACYAGRERRFGLISEQLAASSDAA
ncbi:polyprenyl diphosphate synthase [Malikia spinosa]|uniref:Isoprenyl transferase n=1 Tax=Malikia spinosa TaxID=86180 RepID=A0A2S9KJB8_9BURK|nr:polyprenyl diphosphate synthase [Malikia spinosa]MYZ52953.1 di-trans,poly-cis-decaprenylcistransferase [Malikia spinosa]OGB70914.1 MAG: di-trans,poly-cis-decaprenylcistransferase [Burkholderiales bacterium RIFOXYC12_FULL_65_23]PRD70516.1 di-trans,poly-cis-decaprenylcistransferase [Malikia spinosa]